jgi:hypothetical protein
MVSLERIGSNNGDFRCPGLERPFCNGSRHEDSPLTAGATTKILVTERQSGDLLGAAESQGLEWRITLWLRSALA